MTDIDVFVAHASPDKPLAIRLHAELKVRGLTPFIDALDLLPGDDWDIELPAALKRSRVIAILIGPTYDEAFYLRDEVATSTAYARADATAHRVVPVYLNGFPTRGDDVPYGLRVKNALDWLALGGAPGVADALVPLVAAVRSAPVLGSLPSPAPPRSFRELSRIARYEALVRLLPAQVGEIQLRMEAPSHELPPDSQPLSSRALSIVQWLDVQAVETRLKLDRLLRDKAPGLFE